jgi:hypothetical protein
MSAFDHAFRPWRWRTIPQEHIGHWLWHHAVEAWRRGPVPFDVEMDFWLEVTL